MKLDYVFFQGVAATPRRARFRCRRPVAPPPPVDASDFFRWLLDEAGLNAQAYRSHSLVRRATALLRFLRVSSLAEARRRLQQEPHLVPAAVGIALLGVTEFFRDSAVFRQLEQEVLPAVLSRWPRPRVWSAACSDGQELYSIAMLLASQGRLGGSELVGTDCREDAIRQARGGIFDAVSVEKMEERWRERFFVVGQTRAVIDPALRAHLRWRVSDLLAQVEPGPWHLILWRNMAIYLEPEISERIWKRLCDQLAPGGVIVGGKADHPPKWLPLRRRAACIFQKVATE